ncbi:MAG: lytic transglycosylase domain-containing protein [Candidatus Xenobiia bacterium LiM19]
MTAKVKLCSSLIFLTLLVTALNTPLSAQNSLNVQEQHTVNTAPEEDIWVVDDETNAVKIRGTVTTGNNGASQSARDIIISGNWRYASDEAYRSFPPCYITVHKKVAVSSEISAQPTSENSQNLHRRRSLSSRGGTSQDAVTYVRKKVAEDISPIIIKYAKLYNVSPFIIKAIIEVESAYNPNAISCSGACGLMQLKPSTAYDMGVANYWNPERNIEAGTKYLKLMLDKFNNLGIALAAYNQGPGAVERAGGNPPNYSANRYIFKVLRTLEKL